MIARDLTIPKHTDFFIIGPRQTGKTSLIESVFRPEETFKINLLDHSAYLKYLTTPQILREEVAALGKDCHYIFIDEIQRVPELLNEIQLLIDKKISQKFIMTGSSARKPKKVNANLLGGRAWNLHLYPLSYFELGAEFNLQRALHFGLLPKIYLAANDSDRYEQLKSYLEVYLELEIKAEALVRNLAGFSRFLPIAAQHNAEQINFSNISRDVGISRQTVQDYYSILEDTLLGTFLLPFHYSERKRHKLAPKFYFFDTGVSRALQQKLQAPLVPGSFEFGVVFETFFINEVFKINAYKRKDWKIGFLRTANDVEVDLIIETPKGRFIGIEIKSKSLPQELDYISGYKALLKTVERVDFYCACTGTTKRSIGDVHIWPYGDILSMLRAL